MHVVEVKKKQKWFAQTKVYEGQFRNQRKQSRNKGVGVTPPSSFLIYREVLKEFKRLPNHCIGVFV